MQSARCEIGTRGFSHSVGPGGLALTVIHTHAARLLKIRTKTGSADIRQIIGAIGLGQHIVFGAGHRNEKGFVHLGYS